MDTSNRQINRGRRMRVYVGHEGPLTGVQAFEVTTTQAVDRFGEYDSDEQVVDVQVPETNGFIEILDSEKLDFYRAILGQTDDALVIDSDVGNFASPWIVVNVWNKLKTKYVKSAFVKRPVFTNQPYTTNLNDATVLRWEFSAARFVKLPHSACAIDIFASVVGATQVLTLTKTALQLSRTFASGYVLGATERLDLGSDAYEWVELTIVSSTDDTVTVERADGTALEAGNKIAVYYAYESTSETDTWPGQTG